MTFSAAMWPVFVATKPALDSLFSFSSPLGADYSGRWQSNKELKITVESIGNASDPGIGRYVFAESSAVSSVAYLCSGCNCAQLQSHTFRWTTHGHQFH